MKSPKSSNWRLLAIALAIMLLLLAYPLLVVNDLGKVEYTLLLLLLWSMSAGFVRGIGFIPKATIFRPLLSGTACYAAFISAIGLFVYLRLTRN